MSVLFRNTVVGMMSRDIMVVGRLCMMAWFDAWKDRLVLCTCEWAWLMGFGGSLGKKFGGRIRFVGS